jgi:uncharacterized protein YdeI (YjbR/CyaY-like superfamily)
MRQRFFATPAAFRAWLEKNHQTQTELWVGFHKKETGKPSITWPESVDEALCFGWIDGLRRSLGAEAYEIRFTPRRRGSTWSQVNVAKMKLLEAQGRMTAAGRLAFEGARHGLYSYERAALQLEPAEQARFEADAAAWDFFQARPPSYRRTALYWVVTAKQEATRARRLQTLIEDSAHGRLIKPLRRPEPKAAKGRGRK